MSLRVGHPLPPLDAPFWLQQAPQNAPECVPTATLVHFWAMSCPACKANMPGLQELRAKYEPLRLRTVAVHMPRGPFDMDEEKVRTVAAELGITEPCAIDNDHKIGTAFQTGGVWPVYFLFGADGRLKRHAAGNFGLRMITSAVERLFEQPAQEDDATP